MAVDANIYSLNQFQVAIKYETTIGTANVTDMQLVNVDMPITINDNPFIASDYRTGVGRTKKVLDHFATKEGRLKSISFGGILDTAVGKILLENCAGIETSSGVVIVNWDYGSIANGPAAFVHGYNNSGNKNIYTLTFALISPIGTNTRIYAGCIVDELVFTEDQGTDGGRRHFTCTLLTRYNPSNDQATPSSMVAYPSTYYSIWDYTQHVFGDEVSDKIIWKVELALKSNPRFFGLGLAGKPELLSRGYPGFEANIVVGLKYDANTMSEYLKYPAGTEMTGKISDNFSLASASTGFQTNTDGMRLTADLNLGNIEDGAFIDVPTECFASGTDFIIQIAI